MRYGWQTIRSFPDLPDGGGAPPADAGEGEIGVTEDSGSGGESSGTDEFADLASDERVSRYLKRENERQVSHIPAEHRTPEGFQRLLQAAEKFSGIERDPSWQAFQAGRQGQGEGRSDDAPFHAAIVQALEKEVGQPFNPAQRRFYGSMIDSIAKALTDQIHKTHIEPIRQHLISEHFRREQDEAKRLPEWAKHEPKVREIVQKYGIPYAEAYKIVRFDSGLAGGAAPAVDAQAPPAGKPDRHSSEGDRPSGASAAGTKMPKYKNASEARNGAAAFLRSRGIKVE